mmetsp:Transcript_7682/g.11401  ORF Transcript_7682/g.11401 Transcript_7682/m.11401 type:complete len:408 (+) Transcript_7682:36-1259(+)|eukprot:CAMPEP_0185038778 /NCGR_PEP_ID=MMETSP1103-20130426/34868_1 /TAXON_ID=36769 /ORGANISM="Paraphysomonas bandaiensis, Strain Caron Lab Isolate" /LENGTH=407 /DNA_ID=CAMNT_0027577373 /DNA_START=24 /DNA_END=1247 /DNA_ORIENTATION=-
MPSFFNSISLHPADSLFGVNKACKEDPNEAKINLTVGAYRDDNGHPMVLSSVRQAERIIFDQQLDHEYLPLEGLKEFTKLNAQLVFGDNSSAIAAGKVGSIQCISGTGSLRLAGELCRLVFPNNTIYIPNTTWANHTNIFRQCGIQQATYRYLDSTGLALDFEGLIQDLSEAPEGSIVLLHMVAHNPSGVDPTHQQWHAIRDVIKDRHLLPIVDNAYQGFVQDVDTDAFSVRLLSESGIDLMVTTSCSKNFGLYNERAGCLHVQTQSPEECERVLSHLAALSRTLVSNCPAYGARIVTTILSDPTLKSQWLNECSEMASRIRNMRSMLLEAIKRHNTPGNWDHIVSQQGMFSFTGIPPAVVEVLQKKHHIYMLANGRISLAGLNTKNVDRFAGALAEALGEYTAAQS